MRTHPLQQVISCQGFSSSISWGWWWRLGGGVQPSPASPLVGCSKQDLDLETWFLMPRPCFRPFLLLPDFPPSFPLAAVPPSRFPPPPPFLSLPQGHCRQTHEKSVGKEGQSWPRFKPSWPRLPPQRSVRGNPGPSTRALPAMSALRLYLQLDDDGALPWRVSSAALFAIGSVAAQPFPHGASRLLPAEYPHLGLAGPLLPAVNPRQERPAGQFPHFSRLLSQAEQHFGLRYLHGEGLCRTVMGEGRGEK